LLPSFRDSLSCAETATLVVCFIHFTNPNKASTLTIGCWAETVKGVGLGVLEMEDRKLVEVAKVSLQDQRADWA
jgi:hypothetical protein